MRYAIVVVGVSLGGLRAMQRLLADLPREFCLPVVVAQHRDRRGDDTLATLLQRHCALPVCEAQDKTPLEGGAVFLAPSDYHLLVENGSLALSTEAPVAYARPSIDVLFESAAEAYGEQAVGVVLTGTMEDGARGLAAIAARGGLAVVQDPATAEARAMPDAAIAAVGRARIVPLPQLGRFLSGLCHA